ncbi:MAG: 50S ribosomal protein L1 [Deltaproteobacteria bacterium]|nr:50S ribosomal protein L1 [Deltaproteobacteria bacterium]
MAGKRYREDIKKVEADKRCTVEEAVAILDGFSKAKFDETVDVAIRLGIDPKQTDQTVRGAISLPHGTGRKLRVAVFAKGEKQREATDAGADVVGGDELVEKVQGGWIEFDKVVATPDMMAAVGKLGKVLGPRGLMPNPKMGSVTQDVAKAVKDAKGGRIEFRNDKQGIVHSPVGKRSFGKDKLKDNVSVFLEAIVKAKPATAKGVYLQSITLSATMSPGVKIDPESIAA